MKLFILSNLEFEYQSWRYCSLNMVNIWLTVGEIFAYIKKEEQPSPFLLLNVMFNRKLIPAPG